MVGALPRHGLLAAAGEALSNAATAITPRIIGRLIAFTPSP
jgi:hypothetical protein